MATVCRMLACTAAVVLMLLPFSQAQVLPDVGLSATVLEGQETPTGNTVYGTPRTFSATIVQLGTGGAIQGDLTFFAGATPICTTELNPTSLASATVDLNDLNPDFTIELLNNVLLGNNVLPPGVISVLQPVITSVVGLVGGVVDSANLPAVLTALNVATLNDIAIQTAVIASCTTSTIPVGNYAAVTVAYADLTVGGTTVTLRPVLDTPLLSPTATLALGAFQVTKAPDTVQGTNPAPTLPGATTPFVATVTNTNAGSVLPPDGGTVTATLNGATIGQGTITSTSGKTATFAFPITVPPTATPGAQTITLSYTGTPNFDPAQSGDGTSPAGPTLTVPELVTFTATPSPATPPAGTPVSVAGTATVPSGAIPTGTVTLTVNGVTTGPFTIQPDGTFTGTLLAPAQPSNGTPYPVTVTYAPASPAFVGPTPPYTFPLTVGPATGTVFTTVTPNPVAGTAPVTVSGNITGTNGLPAAGTVDIKVDGSTVLPGVTVNPDGTFTGTFPAPGAPGTYAVTATFNPAPGNSIAGATSTPVNLSVTAPTSTITQTVIPNPAPPGGAATVTGTVTNTNGSPPGGSVTVYLDGVPVGTATVGADGTFTVPFTAPTTPGSYNLLTTYTPTGATAPTASFLTNFVVSSGNGGGTAPTNITISFGNGGNGFTFPNCLGSLTISVSASGSPSPTGNVTLAISGGKLGNNLVTLGTATFANGVATFNLESLKVKKELLDKFITHLTSFKKKLTLKDIRDYDLFPEGDFLLLPGDYTLTATYGGDSVYGPSSGSAPFRVDPLCLLLALALRG